MDKVVDIVGTTIPKRLQFWGSTNPSTPAFIFWGPTGRFVLTRGDIVDLSSRFAHRLIQHGIKPGDVVCVSIPNSPERVIVDFGIQFAGAITMHSGFLQPDGQDLLDAMKLVQCKMLVTDPESETGLWKMFKHDFQLGEIHDDHVSVQSASVPTLTCVEFCKCHKPEKIFLSSLQHEEKCTLYTAKPLDTACMFTTSGSSGKIKFIFHHHKSLLSMARFDDHRGKKVCKCTPFGWVGGYPHSFLCLGITIVVVDETNGEIPDRHRFIWNMMKTENVEIASFSPVLILTIYNQKDIWESSSFKLKNLYFGGVNLERDHFVVIDKLTESVLGLYGSTELGGISRVKIDATNMNSFEDNLVGLPFDGVDIRVVDENLQDVEAGNLGEVLVRSESVCHGSTEQNNELFLPDGWFRTTDVGYMRKDGNLMMMGRRSNAIMHGGHILYPRFLEQKLIKCPGVKQVVIVPVPVPDPILQNEICACIKPESDVTISAQNITEFCKVKLEGELKIVPKYVLTFDVFPVTRSLKLDRLALAKLVTEKLNL